MLSITCVDGIVTGTEVKEDRQGYRSGLDDSSAGLRGPSEGLSVNEGSNNDCILSQANPITLEGSRPLIV